MAFIGRSVFTRGDQRARTRFNRFTGALGTTVTGSTAIGFATVTTITASTTMATMANIMEITTEMTVIAIMEATARATIGAIGTEITDWRG
jgi:hypothetical protein